MNRGPGLVSDEHFQHTLLQKFSFYNKLATDQVSILELLYFSRYQTICVFKYILG